MKLNTNQTIRIGFAFLSICAFWQLYNNVVPLILTNTFHLNETYSGMIMAADNVLALFLLPLFGSISDRTNTRMGRRKPFILFGTIAAVCAMLLLPVIDNLYAVTHNKVLTGVFIAVLALILIIMGTYRSPAVALMPDVTPKPLRSRANAIINLMGALGGIIYLIIATLLYSEKRTAGLDHVNYFLLFAIVAGIMLLSLAIVMFTVDEVALSAKMLEYEAAHPEENLIETDESGKEELPRDVKKSLGFILVSVSLWFISYNAVETWFTTYASRQWNMALGSSSLCLTIATVGAIITYIPAGAMAGKIGRKKDDHGRNCSHDRRICNGIHIHAAVRSVQPDPLCSLCHDRRRLGSDQRKLPAHGRRDVQGKRHRKIHRHLLHLQHGGSDRDSDRRRLADEPCELQHAFPVFARLHHGRLPDHEHGEARGLRGDGKERPRSL